MVDDAYTFLLLALALGDLWFFGRIRYLLVFITGFALSWTSNGRIGNIGLREASGNGLNLVDKVNAAPGFGMILVIIGFIFRVLATLSD